MTIRPAKLADLKVLELFQQKLVAHERPFDSGIPKTGKVEYYQIEKLIRSRKTQLLVAEVNHQVVGCGFAQIRKNANWAVQKEFGYLGFMFVEKEYRGRGISKLLIEKLVGWLKIKQISHITLEVYQHNKIAINAYRKCGFEDFVLQMKYSQEL